MSSFDIANEADVEEQLTPLRDEPLDEEAVVGIEPGPPRDEVDEFDYLEQTEPVGPEDEEEREEPEY